MDSLSAFLRKVEPPRTPALVVRRSAMTANLRQMQEACDTAGVRLRPHGKMAKCGRLATLQIGMGAVGLCCQTVGEAEAYAEAGVRDLLLSAPVPPWGWPMLQALCTRGIRVAAVVDSAAQLAAAREAGALDVRLLADLNGGQQRTGVAFSEAPGLVRQILSAGFGWEGLQCYMGHLQADAGRADAHARASGELAALVAGLREAGLSPQTITGGGTGTAALDLASGLFTELQAGSYAFMDVQYAAAGAPYRPALFCAASIVSRQHKSHVTVDAGLKALASDGPAPRPVAGVPDDCRFRFMGDEHGALFSPAAWSRVAREGIAAVPAFDADPEVLPPAWPPEGSLVWLQPGHVDPTVNLHDLLWVADEDGCLEAWPIDARRKSL